MAGVRETNLALAPDWNSPELTHRRVTAAAADCGGEEPPAAPPPPSKL